MSVFGLRVCLVHSSLRAPLLQPWCTDAGSYLVKWVLPGEGHCALPVLVYYPPSAGASEPVRTVVYVSSESTADYENPCE